MSATAYMAYSYAKDKWVLLGLNLVGDALPRASQIGRGLTDRGNYLYPVMVDVPVKTLSYDGDHYSVVIEDEFLFPEVVTLEQSIENNIKLLSAY
jgi:hypothetical protein